MNTALNQALAHHRSGNLPAAEQGYRKVLKTDPRNPDALHLLGTILEWRGDAAGAIELVQQSIALKPDVPEAHYNLGNILLRQNRPQEAEAHFRRTLALQPDNADAANNLGGILIQLERHGEADTFLARALKLRPSLPGALQNMGALREVQGRFDEALALYDHLLKLAPNDAGANYQRSGALLIRGAFREGWDAYDWRFRRPGAPTLFGRFSMPTWRGEPLAGRRILVWTEQGFGEEILTASMLPDLMAAGAAVVLICSPRLAAVFRRSFPAITVVPSDQIAAHQNEIQKSDIQASMSDLGRGLRPTVADFPRERSFLTSNDALARDLRTRYLAAAPGHKLVGLSWRSFNREVEREKSAPLSAWAEILKIPGLTFVDLQYGPHQAELDAVRAQTGVSIITDPAIDPAGELEAVAAQAAAMDLIISVSNTTVHIAGALGKPVWALIPANRARLWYWQLERDDSIWYPRVRLFRQQRATAWAPVLSQIATSLERHPWR